jgi:hypothetical protein
MADLDTPVLPPLLNKRKTGRISLMTAKIGDSNGKKWEEKTGMGRGSGNLSDGQAAPTQALATSRL